MTLAPNSAIDARKVRIPSSSDERVDLLAIHAKILEFVSSI